MYILFFTSRSFTGDALGNLLYCTDFYLLPNGKRRPCVNRTVYCVASWSRNDRRSFVYRCFDLCLHLGRFPHAFVVSALNISDILALSFAVHRISQLNRLLAHMICYVYLNLFSISYLFKVFFRDLLSITQLNLLYFFFSMPYIQHLFTVFFNVFLK